MPLQLSLPLPPGESSRELAPLQQAWVRSGLALPFELAQRDRAIAICLRCLAEAMQRNHARRRRG